ncbi:DUF4824 family protein [Pseudomonas sp. SCB32]|uniref:DUF4824 family protein n=1 Tax=Pseudomonas sp. SCB32 TaxID=2653853 RepID=UPI0012651284|nr:DUF4824 family protein [Pseudomonas sp. SCB32]
MNWTRTHALFGGVALILLVNAVALGGVAWNRSGTPDSQPRLSQRELAANSSWHKENSGLSLRLNWRFPSDDEGAGPRSRAWEPRINARQMAELGFRMPEQVDDTSARQFDRQQSRAALLVLELDGPLYQRELQLARKRLDELQQAAAAAPGNQKLAYELKDHQTALKSEEKFATRLLLKDVGLDQQALRQRYPDRQRYLIVHGRVRPISLLHKHIWTLGGTASAMGVDSINVPHGWRQVLEEDSWQAYEGRERMQRFVAEVAFGQKLEPWIERIEVAPPGP